MKAVVLKESGGPEKLEITDVPTPEPGPGEARVKLQNSALNRRDVWISLGHYAAIEVPAILGSDGAGVVDAVGRGVADSLVGTEVVIYPALGWGDDPRCFGADFRVLGMPDQGTFAEYICTPADSVVARPAHLSWEEAAAVPLAGLTAWRAVVTQAEVQSGYRVLVTGAGSGVSTFAILWAANHGADVYVTSSSKEKIDRARELGAADGALYTDDDWGKQLQAKAGGFDAVIDSAGGDGMLTCMDLLAPAGRYVFFGATAGNPSQGLDLRKTFWRQNRIQGTTMGTADEFRAMIAFLNEHEIHPLVDSVLPMDRARDAFERVLKFGQTGKVVLNNA